MANTIKLDLVTPERLVISDDFEIITATSVEGEFGVLPGHAPFLALLKPGIVVAKKEGKVEVFATRSGIAEVEPDRVVIMTEKAASAGEINLEETEKELTKTEKESRTCLDSADSIEFKLLREKLDWLRAKRIAATY